MSSPNKSTQPAQEHKPPMPKFVMKFMNPVMKAILRSPLHGRMSDQIMILTFTGRKSGKLFSTPVGYVRKENQVFVFTTSNWWKNFIGGAQVTMLIKRLSTKGTALLIEDAAGIKAAVRELIAANGEARSKQFGFWTDQIDAPPERLPRQCEACTSLPLQ